MTNKDLKQNLTAIHGKLMQISVKGEDVANMYSVLTSLAQIVNNMPEEVVTNEVSDSE